MRLQVRGVPTSKGILGTDTKMFLSSRRLSRTPRDTKLTVVLPRKPRKIPCDRKDRLFTKGEMFILQSVFDRRRSFSYKKFLTSSRLPCLSFINDRGEGVYRNTRFTYVRSGLSSFSDSNLPSEIRVERQGINNRTE